MDTRRAMHILGFPLNKSLEDTDMAGSLLFSKIASTRCIRMNNRELLIFKLCLKGPP